MAQLTPAAAARFRQLFESLDFTDAAIRLGVKSGQDGSEHFIDFVPDSRVDLLQDVVNLTNGVMLIVDRRDEGIFDKITIDYINEPEGFVFESLN